MSIHFIIFVYAGDRKVDRKVKIIILFIKDMITSGHIFCVCSQQSLNNYYKESTTCQKIH